MKKFFKRSGYSDSDSVTVALAGNPNVGKSTLFNTLTGMHRHTGNWSGKTVDNAIGEARYEGRVYKLADIPGTYSLLSHSEEERVARDYICFGGADVTVVVCDATALSRGLILFLEVSEVADKTVLCLNLCAEARKKGINIDTGRLSELLGVSVVEVEATRKGASHGFFSAIQSECYSERRVKVKYSESIERGVKRLAPVIMKAGFTRGFSEWASLRLIEGDSELSSEIFSRMDEEIRGRVQKALSEVNNNLFSEGMTDTAISDSIAECVVSTAEKIAEEVTTLTESKSEKREKILDKILTGRVFAFPVMALFVMLLFYLTLSLANYPSEILFRLFGYAEQWLSYLLSPLPEWLSAPIVYGAFRTLGTVVSVMLVPMAIFFPLFTILEDSGYLPRIAYNLDRPFASAGACGKQALTMCMGIGCNCVGVSGCAIIDSKRERNIAILTNSLVPCNGKLPMLITLIGVLILFTLGRESPLFSALLLSLLLVIAVIMTFAVTRVLSSTAFRGECSAFTIELPPYRRPRFMKVIAESLLFRVAAVLKRAVIVSLPTGLIIYILCAVAIDGVPLIKIISDALLPIGSVFGVDGVVLVAFLLGIVANEIIIPIMLMIYMGVGAPVGTDSLSLIAEVISDAGWTLATVLSVTAIALFHAPCSTTLLTVYKETKSIRYTALAFLIPSVIGLTLAAIINLASLLFA